MFGIQRVKIHTYEKGLYFRDGEFVGLLEPGRHWLFALPGTIRVDVVSQREPWLFAADLDVIVRSGVLKDQAVVLDLKDHQRALVWIDGRFDGVLPAGLFALWTGFRDVRVEVVDARGVHFEHDQLAVILKSAGAVDVLDSLTVAEDHAGVLYRDGKYVQTLGPGLHAFWKKVRGAKVHQVDMRELALKLTGQEIMTADKVTLRLSAVVTYRVADAAKSVAISEDAGQALYREAQLAVRAVVGTRQLDELLADKDAVADELEAAVKRRGGELGLEVIALGIRDVILPGEMKDLMNKVTEARKAAEANLIVRREETAAMRSQANTAKLLESNPVLMRLRELELLEKFSGNSKLCVFLGEKGLTDRVVNLL